MNTDEREELNRLSAKVIGAAQKVSSLLGCGFLEKVYENALAVELRSRALSVTQQSAITIRYEEAVVGEYFADIVVDDRLIVELKTVKAFDPIHEAQCINYLRASGLHLCLLMNFARPRLDVRRIINT
ncbi:MAG TPA: GxxExxY protein [Usitatibacter sp.]|jgi:GxxExxY protein|nr:GxxExxY protein [Usitatibacter sp.]